MTKPIILSYRRDEMSGSQPISSIEELRIALNLLEKAKVVSRANHELNNLCIEVDGKVFKLWQVEKNA